MPKSKKYRKKPRGYKRKLANAPHLYNRQEPPRFGDAYNRSNAGDPSINAFHIGNRRYQDREKLESLKRLKNREGIQTGMMAENFKKIESAYYSSTAVADRISTGLQGIQDEVKGLNNQAPRHVPVIVPGGGPVLAPPVVAPPPPGRGGRFFGRLRMPGGAPPHGPPPGGAPPPGPPPGGAPPGRRGSTGGLPPGPPSSPQSSMPPASPATSPQHILPPLDPWPATRGITPTGVTTPQRNSVPAHNQDDATPGRSRLTRVLASPATLISGIAQNSNATISGISDAVERRRDTRREGRQQRDSEREDVRRNLDQGLSNPGMRRSFSAGVRDQFMAGASRLGEVSDSNITLTE